MATRNDRKAELMRLSKWHLIQYYRDGILTPRNTMLRCVLPQKELERWQKGELVNAILDAEFGTGGN